MSLMLFAVVDFVSSDMENVAQKCSLSYKVKGTAPKSWYINQRAQSCLAHGKGWAYLGGTFCSRYWPWTCSVPFPDIPLPPGAGCSQTCAPGPVLCLPCQWSRPLRGAQELHCHPAHWQPEVGASPTSSARGWACCTRLCLPAQALNFSLQTILMH